MSPAEVKSEQEVLKLSKSGWDGKNFWALLNWNGSQVTLSAQKVGENTTAQIQIPKRTFKRICEWYLKGQVPSGRKHK